MAEQRPRLGVIGTGVWAGMIHLRLAAQSESVRLTSVYGRRAEAVEPIAAQYAIEGFTELDAFLDSVDIVAISVTPEAQPGLALAAARAGKHVLLEKPVATDRERADAVASALEERSLASVVFFTQMLSPGVAAWVEELRATGGWRHGRDERFAGVLVDDDNPFHETPWRADAGGLWDLGPHAVAMMVSVLGPVASVSALAGDGDLRVLSLQHEHAVSTVSVCMDSSVEFAAQTQFTSATVQSAPPTAEHPTSDAAAAYESALRHLAAAVVGEPSSNRYDARFGAHVTAVLAAAESSLLTGHRETV